LAEKRVLVSILLDPYVLREPVTIGNLTKLGTLCGSGSELLLNENIRSGIRNHLHLKFHGSLGLCGRKGLKFRDMAINLEKNSYGKSSSDISGILLG
jgi:hypothetical protein